MVDRAMSAVQEAIGQRERALRRLIRWPSCWPLLAMPTSLIVCVLAVLACDLALTGWELAATPPRGADLLLFGALLAAAVICIEAMRRLGQPSGVSRDLLSAWWLPIALLLPPLYALLAPFAVGVVLAARARRIPVYRRVFSSAALGLAGAATSATFHLAIPNAVLAGPDGERAWLTRPSVVLPPVILLQRSLLHQQLAAAARTDPKTGLLNATAWQREADAEVARALRTDAPLALLLVDVDHFKRVNDSHGHLIGDEVLRALATELRQQVRESDVVGRFGGEEFTVLLPRTDDASAYGIAERLRASAANLSVAAADARISVTVSIGAAVLGQHGNDLFELLTAADVALYRAKDAGRDQVRVYAHSAGKAATSEHADEATDACP